MQFTQLQAALHASGLFSEADSPPALLLAVDVPVQQVQLFYRGEQQATYPVSTSRFGVGNLADSHCTPSGWHAIAEKIGAGCAQGEIFRARVAQGCVYDPASVTADIDVITSRILWLCGLEPGINLGPGCDSYERYIYIHGTADEAAIGTPASIGCVRMRNRDVIDLFDLVDEGTPVLIYNGEPEPG